MTQGFHAPTCACGHRMGDHKSGKSSGWFPPVFGVCFRCDCKSFREVESVKPEEDEAA